MARSPARPWAGVGVRAAGVGRPGRDTAARSAPADVRIARIHDGLREPGGGPGHTGNDEQHCRQAGGGAQPPDPSAGTTIGAEPRSETLGRAAQQVSDVSGDVEQPLSDRPGGVAQPLDGVSCGVAQPDGHRLEVVPRARDRGEHARVRRRPPANSRGGLPEGDLRTDPGESVVAWLDRVRGQPQRVAQGPLEHGLAWFRAAVAHVSRSSTDRSAASAREVWLLTAPLVIPIAAAICASDMSP
jgi:hypothetical protein